MGFQHGASLQQAGEPNLPMVRQDLFILPSVPSWTGAPSWIIHDGIANRYFRIDATRMAILSRWKPIPADALAEQLSLQEDTLIAVSQIKALARFLLTNSLIENAGPDEWQFYQKQKEGTRQSLWKKMVHNYLFFRVPLVKPQRFLDFIWPLVAGFFTTTSAIAFVLLAILGLYLVSHQWDVFQATFVSFLTLNGLLLYGSSLVCIKIFHEMGHALMARKYGVHVPVIGVAFIVLMPVLYTDTTSAHRLISRFKRLNIDLAGIYAELALATLATICWVFLPDGPLRSIAFTTATLSWVISLAVNLNPFMRFDGYYILSDLFGFENLQERSFLIAKWRLRETLFDLGEPVPEVLPKTWCWPLIAHAWGTWIYRFFLFLGIALLVYTFFIKLVGILLFCIEIAWFIVTPIGRELKYWWTIRKKIMLKKRGLLTFGVVAGLAIFLFLPINSRVEIPAVMQPRGAVAIYAPHKAVLIRSFMKEGDWVEQGNVLAKFTSPDLEEEMTMVQLRIDLLKARMARSGADQQDLSLRPVLQRELEAMQTKKKGIENLVENLIVQAPFSGKLTNVAAALEPGQWMNSTARLALITPDSGFEVTGLVSEDGINRMKDSGSGYFIPDAFQLPSIAVKLIQRSNISEQTVFAEVLADVHGGQIPTQMASDPASSHRALIPRGAWYFAKLKIDEEATLPRLEGQKIRGIVKLYGEPQSYAARIGRQVASVLLREISP